MSFSASWLDLREKADHAARSPAITHRLAAYFAGSVAVTVVDLGSGTGSNLRATAPHLPGLQHWTLVDHDEALLEAAGSRLHRDAAEADTAALPWRITLAGRKITVTPRCADLAEGLAPLLSSRPELVTASALFDLVSAEAIARMVADIAAAGAAFSTVLTYDGTGHWTPPHRADTAVLDAFNRHMTRDKGLGPAAGPAATAALATAFKAHGYEVAVAPSPWVLTRPADSGLMDELMSGIAGAVADTGAVDAATLAAWQAARRHAHAVNVGHLDLIALPPRQT
jgi:predicted RNA methylase